MEKTFTGKSQEEANYRAYKWVEERGNTITDASVVSGSAGANDPETNKSADGIFYTNVHFNISSSGRSYTIDPQVIAIGHLVPSPGEAPQYFKIYQLADDTIEFQFGAGGHKWILKVDRMTGSEVALAIEKTIGGTVTIDYEHSTLQRS